MDAVLTFCDGYIMNILDRGKTILVAYHTEYDPRYVLIKIISLPFKIYKRYAGEKLERIKEKYPAFSVRLVQYLPPWDENSYYYDGITDKKVVLIPCQVFMVDIL